MALAARVGDVVAGGGSLIFGSNNVFVNNIPVSLIGTPVTPHACCGAPGCDVHCSASVAVSGVTNLFVNNIQPVTVGSVATCGDPVISGSVNVFFG